VVAFDGFLQNQQLHEEEVRRLLPMAGLWAHYVCGFFIRAYKERAKGSILLPSQDGDFELMLQYFLVQKAITIFNGCLKRDPQRLIIPVTMLRSVLRTQPDAVTRVPAPGGTPSAVTPSMVS
jgi:maltose alpha-D-glucosyltransferase/alpha-amylase